MQMEPRILKPEKGNKYYIHTKDGGYNPAKGNPSRKNKYLTSLPNCIAIYGWFNEIGQKGQVYLKKPWYPYAVIRAAKSEGLEVTQEPTPGGIMVWTGGKDGDGHVGGCAVVYDKDHILTVESEYYGKDWAVFNRSKGDGNWRSGCYWMDSSYKYRGCIKNPFMEEDDMTYEKFVEYMNRYLAERAQLPPSYEGAEKAIEEVKKAGIMVGDPDGNFRPMSFVTRQELAQVESNLLPDK